MYSCNTCSLKFKQLEDYKVHLKSTNHLENSSLTNIKSYENLPNLTISSDSLASLEHQKSENKNELIKNELFKIKDKLRKLEISINELILKI